MTKRALLVLLGLVFWSWLGLVFAAQTYLSAAVLARPIPWRYALGYALPGWYIWAALAPLVAWLGSKIPLAKDRLLFAAVLHLTVSALLSLLQTVLVVALMFVTMPAVMGDSYAATLRFHIQLGSHLNLLTYWTILAVAHAASYYRNAQQRELKATQLAAGLAQARLDALRMELNPHFLFNTLNTVSSLVYSRPRAADQMIAQLGELLRITLQARDRNEVTLDEEIRYVRSYVAIEQVRLGDRLSVVFDVDPNATGAGVPSLLLQPLVENAIRYGIAPDRNGGKVEVRARRAGAALQLIVSDTGTSVHVNGDGHGIGLSNTRARLQHMYGPDHSFAITHAEAGGSVVTITIPYKARVE